MILKAATWQYNSGANGGVCLFFTLLPTLTSSIAWPGQATPLCEQCCCSCAALFLYDIYAELSCLHGLTEPNLLLENEWQASSISRASWATLPWAVTQLWTEWETYMKKETVKMNQGVVLFLLNQNCIDAIYASATSEVMLSKSLRICDWKIRVLSFRSDTDTYDKLNCPIFVSIHFIFLSWF